MKNFDLAAAKCGAIVCTKAGWAARILCFNFNGNDEYHICAAVMRKSVEFVQFYMDDGRTGDTDDSLDLMMADDDYLEKLERGEYDHIGEATEKVGHILTYRDVTPSVELITPFDESYWRRMYAGMAMQGLMADNRYKKLFIGYAGKGCKEMSDNAAMVASKMAEALIEKLKKEKE